MFVEQGTQSQRSGTEMDLGRTGRRAHLPRMRAAHLPATPATMSVGDQSDDTRSHDRQIFDDLLTGTHVLDRTAALRAALRTHLGLLVEAWRRPLLAGMPLLPPGTPPRRWFVQCSR